MSLLDAGREPLAGDLDRPRTPALVGAVWTLLIVNTLGSQGDMLLSLPRSVLQMITMGSLLMAFALALVLNPRIQVRPSAYLFLLTLLVVVAFASSARLEAGWGSMFRVGRFALLVATLWLLSRWWDDALTFVRHHIKVLTVLLLSVAAGLLIAPGRAMSELDGGRLSGVLWPLTATQVGQYSAVAAGLAIVLWMSRRADTRSVVLITAVAVVLLFLSHTRTAAFGLAAGLGTATLSLVLTSARARKAFTVGAVVAGLGAVVFGSAVQAWILRGQDDENFTNLTGRAKVWDALLTEPRTLSEQLFGIGLTNKSFNGLPIDSSWLAVYHEEGILGLTIVVLFLGTLVVAAALRPPSPSRACAVFLIVYCLAASYTESGLGDASTYLLYLALAAALLTSPQRTPT